MGMKSRGVMTESLKLPYSWVSLGLKGSFLVHCSSTNFLSVCSYLTSAQHTKLIITIPVRHIPAWLPYISYKPLAEFGRNLGQEMVYEPMRFVKESIVGNDLGTRAFS